MSNSLHPVAQHATGCSLFKIASVENFIYFGYYRRMIIQKIYIGGWFQRTTLHLTEVWDFMAYGKSNLNFSKEELNTLRQALEIKDLSRENVALEYIRVETSVDIGYRIYEDGLMVLEKSFENLEKDFHDIKEYYDTRLSKGISLIFSKGAPVPKELANIKTILPYILTISGGSREEIQKIFDQFFEPVYSILSSKNVEVYRSPGIIVIHNLLDEELAREIIESQIFFREFKSQLHRYLAIHRTIWEKIAKIKERGEIRGTEVDALRAELSDYQKTINLISARINQMGSYIKTRQKITDLKKMDDYLNPLFQFKFETLLDTHEYIKHLWEMTKSYLNSALEVFGELQAKSTKNTISSLQLITTIGVVAGLIGYLGRDKLPNFTSAGLVYFAILIGLTWLINTLISYIYKNSSYKIKNKDFVKDIK